MKRTLTVILAIILAFMSLIALIIKPVVGVIGLIIAIVLIVTTFRSVQAEGERDAAAFERESEARAAEFIRQTEEKKERRRELNSVKVPSGKYKKTMSVKVVGVTHACEKNKVLERQTILEEMHDGDRVIIEPYTYAGDPAYLVIDPMSGCDVGALPEDFASLYPNETIEGFLTGFGSFMPDDKDDEIYYSRVKIYIMEDA